MTSKSDWHTLDSHELKSRGLSSAEWTPGKCFLATSSTFNAKIGEVEVKTLKGDCGNPTTREHYVSPTLTHHDH